MPASPPLATPTRRSSRPLRLPAIHLVFGLAKRWLLGTHHGAISQKHLPAYLDEFVSRFSRRTAKSLSHRFARVIEHAVQIQPATYRDLIATPSPT
jgi:ISXO2-like transposase domain